MHVCGCLRASLAAVALALLLAGCGEDTATPTSPSAPPNPTSAELTGGWALVAADMVRDEGGTVSQVGYDVHSWYPVTLPSTVLAGLVANGVYKDIFVGTNLQSIPDLTTHDWWYRGEFTAPAAAADQQYWLRFKGIAYRAEIWLNGTRIDANAVGTLVNHDYNVTSVIHPDTVNALALRITPPASSGDNLSFWYVDWNPKPPDMNGGIWGKVLLETTGPLALRDPYVQTVLPLPRTDAADVTVYVDAVNGSPDPVTAVLGGEISRSGSPTITFSQTVAVAANERREIVFDPAAFPQLQVHNPVLWWPINMGDQPLYDLHLTLTVDGKPCDTRSLRFGIRQITDYTTVKIYGRTYKGYRVNGQNVLIRGADYVWDLLMRWDSTINRTHMQYVKDMGLNAVRFEGILGNEEIYDLADQYGILLMPGYVCCTYWADFTRWTGEDRQVANASLDSQMRLLRAHPSALVWAYGSDELPPQDVLAGYGAIAEAVHWQNPTLDNVASYNNLSSSVPKMNGPYVWEPPVYWYADTRRGGAFGFCAEEGGEAVPPEETLRKFLPAADLWPIDAAWDYHVGLHPFENLDNYSPGIDKRYGTATAVSDYAAKAQLLNYEAIRAQFEAFGANAYTLAQGTIYWMLNSAWPSLHWNLYDYYFKPGGSYFGAKKALEPVHIIWDYNTNAVKVFNSTLADAVNLTAAVEVYNIPNLALQYADHVRMDFPANASSLALTIPPIGGLTPTYLVRLQLKDEAGSVVSNNVYWYSTSPDVLAPNFLWYLTFVQSYADLTGLSELPRNTSVAASAVYSGSGGNTVRITLANRDPSNVAFFVRAEMTAGEGGLEVLPILYTDNYVTLWPGEATTITATFASADLGGQPAWLRVEGYNMPRVSIPVS